MKTKRGGSRYRGRVVPTCHPEKKHAGHGLCQGCYSNAYYHANIEKQRKWQRDNYAKKPELRARMSANSKRHNDAKRAEDPRIFARRSLKRRYGLTEERYQEMLASQNGGCAICGTKTPGGMGRFHVDHNHSCCAGRQACEKCIRGLLCYRCNTGVEPIESRAFYEKAIAYLCPLSKRATFVA